MRVSCNRRKFLALTGSAAPSVLLANSESRAPLENSVGLVAATLAAHQAHRVQGGIDFLDLPKITKDTLGMRVLDLNTMNLPLLEPRLLEQFRSEAAKLGVSLTNLKLNQRGIQIGSKDPEIRAAGLATYREAIDAAAILGIRWVRPLPTAEAPDRALMIDSLRQLADYAGVLGIQVLVENFGWLQHAPDSVAKLIAECDCGLAASPDTGNWADNKVRYLGLEQTFPLAVTCDFKAKTLTKDYEHPAYDLNRCFQIGWDAGFRGPWCIEHGNPDKEALFRELLWIRDQLEGWMREA